MCLIILEFLTWFILKYFLAFPPFFFGFLIILNVRRRGKLVDLVLHKYFHLFHFITLPSATVDFTSSQPGGCYPLFTEMLSH